MKIQKQNLINLCTTMIFNTFILTDGESSEDEYGDVAPVDITSPM